ncbi:MAG: helix-turn-helix domain-containing protein [Proteobacteria bacterium]|nr:helix-turn-helix domain-containing protein [Pseudomonadota bacterium]
MIEKKLLQPNRVRHIDGGFSFIPHRFLTDGFLASLNQMEILLYLFLVLVSDRYGLSFYSYDAICSFLQITLDQYIEARDSLIRKDLIASDGTLFQVLDLPKQPVEDPVIKQYRRHIKTTIQQSLWGN